MAVMKPVGKVRLTRTHLRSPNLLCAGRRTFTRWRRTCCSS